MKVELRSVQGPGSDDQHNLRKHLMVQVEEVLECALEDVQEDVLEEALEEAVKEALERGAGSSQGRT